MGYDIHWLVPNRLLKMSIFGDSSDGEMKEAYLKHVEIVKAEGEPPVHVIFDASKMTNLEIKIREIGAFTDTTAASLFGWTLIITDNRFMKFLVSVFAKLTGSQFKIVENYEEAIAILKKQVPELVAEIA